MSNTNRILVIKLSALGDIIQSFPSFEQIRLAHPRANITLLTTPPYESFARASGLFDEVETDGRPKKIADILRLFRRLRRARYQRVYDLQNSNRTKNYIFGFLPSIPEWSGISIGASHRQARSDRNTLHNLDRFADQLYVAGISPQVPLGLAPAPDLKWAARLAKGGRATTAERFGLRRPFALLVPGASPVKPEKFWPAHSYGRLAMFLTGAGLQVAIVGSKSEAALALAVQTEAPDAVDLTGETDLLDLAGLGAEADLCVGNDTGPTHLISNAGAPGLMLMSRITDPNHCAPRRGVDVLHVDDLSTLSVETVVAALQTKLKTD